MSPNFGRRVQSNPKYRDQTTLIYSPDHGRGPRSRGLEEPQRKYPGSENIWIAVIGPDTPPLGERSTLPAAHSKPDRRHAGPLPGRRLLRRRAQSGQTDRGRLPAKIANFSVTHSVGFESFPQIRQVAIDCRGVAEHEFCQETKRRRIHESPLGDFEVASAIAR